MNERKPAKSTRVPKAKEASEAPKRRRKAAPKAEEATFRHGDVVITLNPGQAHLMQALANEFPGELQANPDAPQQAPELVATGEDPGVAKFLCYQLLRMAEQQAALEALLSLEA